MKDPDRLPFFVYGTLRPGYGNAGRWEGRADARHDGTVLAYGLKLVAVHHGFPHGIRTDDADDVTVGALIFPHADQHAAIMKSLDVLEGHPRHYLRQRIGVEVPGQELRVAWTYAVPAPDYYEAHGEPVPNNDWATMAPRREERSWAFNA